MQRLTSLLLALLCVPLVLTAQTKIEGTVSTESGDRIPLAHVHLYPFKGEMGMKPISTTEVGKDGKYSISISEPGFYRLIVTGVNHDYFAVPVSVEEGKKSVQLDMHPPMLSFDHAPEEVMIIGDWNNFDFENAEPMKRGKDDTFTYTFKTDGKEIRYQLLGVVQTTDGGMRSVNAPGSADYVYDGGGDYRSIMKVKPGSVTIKFDPKDLPGQPADNEPFVRFDDPALQKLWDIDLLYTRRTQRFRQAAIAAQEKDEAPDVLGIWTPFKEEMEGFTSEENDPTVRRFAALYMARLLKYSYNPKYSMIDDEDLATIRELLPLNSSFWSAEPALATVVAMQGAEDENAAILEVVKISPDRTVRGIALSQVAMNEYYAGNHQKAAEYYQKLKADYSDLDEVSYVLAELNPDKRIQNGKEVPEFEVVLVGNKGEATGTGKTIVSKESMKGKYYLIDFWATWCGPCVGEMGSLHAAYEKFGGEQFEVLSISFDEKQEDIEKFRAAKWDMPWLHAFANGGFDDELAKTFEVSGIPKPILVDPNGMIVATEGELRGSNLETTLSTYLGDGQASR